MVSVIIPVYNVAKYIAETIDSVLHQSFNNYEIIIINDGSPDTLALENIFEKYWDEIVYIKQERQGPGMARNKGIENARGKLLAFLDGDDVWLPDFLESQVEFLGQNNLDLVYANALLFGEDAPAEQSFMKKAPSNGEVTFDSLLAYDCNVILSGTVANKQCVVEAGMFGTEPRGQDYNLWLRMAHQGSRMGYQKKVLLKYRVRTGSVSGDSIQRIERELDSFERIAKMIRLSQPQKDIIARQKARLQVDLEVEKGKSFLVQERFGEAKRAFESANRHRRSISLFLIITSLRIAPRLFLKIYQVLRRDEIVFLRREHKNPIT